MTPRHQITITMQGDLLKLQKSSRWQKKSACDRINSTTMRINDAKPSSTIRKKTSEESEGEKNWFLSRVCALGTKGDLLLWTRNHLFSWSKSALDWRFKWHLSSSLTIGLIVREKRSPPVLSASSCRACERRQSNQKYYREIQSFECLHNR